MKGGMDLLREFLLIYFTAVNQLAFTVCGWDKWAA